MPDRARCDSKARPDSLGFDRDCVRVVGVSVPPSRALLPAFPTLWLVGNGSPSSAVHAFRVFLSSLSFFLSFFLSSCRFFFPLVVSAGERCERGRERVRQRGTGAASFKAESYCSRTRRLSIKMKSQSQRKEKASRPPPPPSIAGWRRILGCNFSACSSSGCTYLSMTAFSFQSANCKRPRPFTRHI